MLTFAVCFGIATILTFLAFKGRAILFRMAGILGWLGIGILAWTSPVTIGISTFPAGAQYVISLICVVMLIAIATMQMQTDIRHEMNVRGKQGYPGAETATWTTWGPNPNKKKMSRSESDAMRQQAYQEELRGSIKRGIQRRRGY